ncbi:MAG: DUF4391 domain-containing protein [Bacteroidetes bacterium]|nr:DUF4391 domain-containing protein [Bacteroidota bacterium]
MVSLTLPISTNINRAIPKNSFDKYTNTKQRKQFSEYVDKIRWTNKLSIETINLNGKEISEIQVFEIRLKKKEKITDVLAVIDRAIPYPIIFKLIYQDEAMFSVSQKHPHPLNENNTVIDWTFSSEWFQEDSSPFALNLKQSLDHIFTDFCKQLAGKQFEKLTLVELVQHEQKLKELNRTIANLEAAIKANKQFNKKVELNLELKKAQMELQELLNI